MLLAQAVLRSNPPGPTAPSRSGSFKARPPQARAPQAKPPGSDFTFKARKSTPVVINRLPQGNIPVHRDYGRYRDRRSHSDRYRYRDNYYYHRGRYYRPYRHGYVVAYPPRGVVVPLLPAGFATLMIGSMAYYHYQGIYYTRVPSGYQVVDPPPDPALDPQPLPPASPYGPVTVTAPSLNVRTGPGTEYQVVAVVRQAETYPVQAIAPGWLYIVMPDGQYGWVREIYTAPALPVPSG